MSNIIYYPNAGRMPSLDALPVSLHATIGQLANLACVQGVISGVDPYQNKMVLLITYNDGHVAELRKTLDCFKGFWPEYMRLYKQEHYLQLILHQPFIAA